MTRLEKLIERLKARPPEADLGDVPRLLEAFGYRQMKQRGSHISFKKPGSRAIIVPAVKGRKVKRAYVDEICDVLGLDELDD
jgi:predicted RNA binding protein YcfA (HicA-like mRNA interferase family)